MSWSEQEAQDREWDKQLRIRCVNQMRALNIGETLDASKTKHGQRAFRKAIAWAKKNCRETFSSHIDGQWLKITRLT